MIFREELAVQIVRGEKTATRRLPVHLNPRSPWRVERPWRYPVGKRFAVQPGRSASAIAQAEVTRRYMQPLGKMEHADAEREGFRTADGVTASAAFRAAWAEINKRYNAQTLVHVVEFRLIGPDCMGCDGCGWCEGSPAFDCPDCFATGVEVSIAAKELIRRLDREAAVA